MLKNIFSNQYFNLAMGLGALGGLLSDQIGKGYIWVILVATIFILYAIYDEYNTKKIYQQRNLSIPVIFNISNPTDSKSTLNILFSQLEKEYSDHKENLEKYFNIIEDDLIFHYNGDIYDEDRFIDFLKISKHGIKKLEAQTPKDVHFHVVYIGPIATAIEVGTIFATEKVTLYQHNRTSNTYTKLPTMDNRKHKELVKEFKIINRKDIGKINKEVTVAIDAAAHKVAITKLGKPIVHLESKLGATIKNDEDFITLSQEIYTVLNELQISVNKIKLVYSMPTTIAFILGMSIQTYWNIELTQYNDGNYKTIIKTLNKIKYYF